MGDLTHSELSTPEMLQNKKNARVFNGPHVEVALATDTFRVDCRQLFHNRIVEE
jgi:hypothetical protein